MTRAAPIGERVGVVEEAIINLKEDIRDFKTHISRMEDTADLHQRNIGGKIEMVLKGQQSGAEERARQTVKIEGIEAKIAVMAPHVETVAHAKTFWSWSGKIGAFVTAVGAGGWWAWSFLKQYFTFRGH